MLLYYFINNNLYIKFITILVWLIFPFILGEKILLLFNIIVTLYLMFYHKKSKLFFNPFYIVVFLSIHYLMVYLFSNQQEIIDLQLFTQKLWSLMNIGLFISIYIFSEDYIYIMRKLKVADNIIKVFIALVNFIPESIRSIALIIESQKSRGLEISFKTVLNLTAFKFITVPFILYILRAIYYSSMNVSLREINVSDPKLILERNDLFILVFSSIVVIINIY